LLRTHKLKGKLEGSWACSAGYDLRIIFEFVPYEGSEAIVLESIGTHREVYLPSCAIRSAACLSPECTRERMGLKRFIAYGEEVMFVGCLEEYPDYRIRCF